MNRFQMQPISDPLNLNDLNPPQIEAVLHNTGPILVLAGAGSGKTRVLTRRIAHLVSECGVSPRAILAVTFTNKATEEMRHRLGTLLGDKAEQLWIGTFHSMALRMLRRFASRIGYTSDFIVYDDDDSKGVIKSVLKERQIDEKRFPVSFFSREIDRAKNSFVTDAQYPEALAGSNRDGEMIAQVYSAYQDRLKRSNAMDFGDLLVNALQVLRDPQVRLHYERGLEYVLVDEFQDTNKVQYLLVRTLAAPQNNIFVVGDDDQSIYAFRGATIQNILNFERDYAGAKVVKLEQNYRSSGNVLEAAHGVISKNAGRKPKKLWTSAGRGAQIRCYGAADEEDEAKYVMRAIFTAHSDGRTKYSDIAVFYRTNAQSRAIEEELLRARIPYKIFGGLKFYERKEIKDILAYLRLIRNNADDQAFQRVVNVPARGIGAQTVSKLVESARAEGGMSLFTAARQQSAGRESALSGFVQLIEELKVKAEQLPLDELVGEIIDRTQYVIKLKESRDPTVESRVENIKELCAVAARSDEGSSSRADVLAAFLDRVALTTSAEIVDSRDVPVDGYVSLMTLHLAKGLEFPVVFLTGLEEGLLPHFRSIDEGNVEEERRLCYVGITRAMRDLHITRATMRGVFSASGGSPYREPSRFFSDIPAECLERGGADFYASSGGGEDDDFNVDWDDGYNVNRRPRTATYAATGRATRAVGVMTADALVSGRGVKQPARKAVPEVALPLAAPEQLHPGVSVRHKTFGDGEVVSVSGDPSGDLSELEVAVRFAAAGEKKLIFKFARLWLKPESV